MMEETDDIAVVGIGCNFPGGEGLDNFWQVLLEGKNCVVDIPEERFDRTFWYDPDHNTPGKTQTNKAAFIDGFNEFDHKFFGITEAEADFMDPQQKLLLQCTFRAFEDAGIPVEKMSGTSTGVYIGLMNRDYETLLNNSPSTITHYNGTGTAMSMAANRISFIFNLTGPSFSIDSACSSSLVALHSACQAIKQGDCEMAVCGGVSCIMEPRVFVALSKAKMISPEGTSKPFSSRADGYGRGEGCGVILLKPLKRALQDFDKVWGIVRKTAVNQDGHSVTPITKPSKVQQEELLRRIYSESDVSAVQYIEAHGTGTPVGDPIEAGSISKVIAKARPPSSETLRIGSVKGNIGHTESAAGIAGLIKVLLMMKHETIVPSLFYSEDSASIDAKALNIKVPTKAERWEKSEHSERLAGVNSFGFGGTNAHVILKEYVQGNNFRLTRYNGSKLFVLSASSEMSLSMSITDTHHSLSTGKHTEIFPLSFTSACRRSHLGHKYRKAFLTLSVLDLENQLKSAMNKKLEPSRTNNRLVFVFCGNGLTYRGMCKQLLKEEPVFREKIKEIENLFQNYKAADMSQKITNNYDNDDDTKPDVVQPLLFAIQVGIVSLFKHWGIKPDAILGHSVGEVAAAHCSGLLSLDDAVKVIYFRSTLQSKVTEGKMLVVSNMAVSEVVSLLPSYSNKVCLAAFNSPQSCTLSGDGDAIDSLHQKLKNSDKTKNIFLHILDVPAAYHSQMMDPIVDHLEKCIGTLKGNKMECELFSTVTGNIYTDGDFITGRYWAKNIRETVSFERTMKAATRDQKNMVIVVEIGPRRALQRNIQETLGKGTIVLSSVQPEKDHETMLTTVSKLFELGVNVDWDMFYKGYEVSPTTLPRYQFDNLTKDVHFEAVRRGQEKTAFSHHPLISQTNHESKEYKCNLSMDIALYLWEHKYNGVSIAPGALYVELALASVMASSRPKMPICSMQLNVTFQSIFTLRSNCNNLKVVLEVAANETLFKIQSRSSVHASGTVHCQSGQIFVEEQTICLEVIFKRCKSVISGEKVYSVLSRAGFQYGPVFRQLGDVHFGHEFKEAVSSITVPGEVLKQLHEYFLHPVVLDYFLQMTAVVAVEGWTTRQGFPSGIGSVAVTAPLQEHMVMYLKAINETSDYIDVCGCFSNKDGHVLVELKHVRISFLGKLPHITESFFFHNERFCITDNTHDLSFKPKALIFEDTLGVGIGLKPYVHKMSSFFPNREFGSNTQVRDLVSHSLRGDAGVDLQEILFMWGIQDLSHLTTEMSLECLVDCCENYRQLVLALKENKCSCTIRVITYQSAEMTVDHVNPGFVLSGMTRACAAEIPGLSFQLIDLDSVSSENIHALVHVLNTSKHPEIMITKGQIYSTVIVRTPMKEIAHSDETINRVSSPSFTIQTADPYRMSRLSAMSFDREIKDVQEKSVEIQLSRICVHSSDYFPVSVSDLKFGQTLYWNKHATQDHQLLALDFGGTVTAIGKDVRNLKVGDHVVSCFPVRAASKITIPEEACYKTKGLQFLKETPCVSYYVLAWEILHRVLPKVKQKRHLGIISSVPDSGLLNVLIKTANRSGWNAIVLPQLPEKLLNMDQCNTVIVIPPFDPSVVVTMSTGPATKHIVVVCNNQSSLVSANNFTNESDHAHIQTLHLSNVFQRANLKAQKRKIYNWLRSLHLDGSSQFLQSITFQSTDMREPQPSAHCETNAREESMSQIVVGHADLENTLSQIPLRMKPRKLFKKRCVYLVTGGLSGLGLETVKFIAHRGGGCIVTLSRRPLSAEMQIEVDTIQKTCGVSIMSVQCDVSESAQVTNAISVIGRQFPLCEIKGVFHSAAVLHDALIETLERSHFSEVLRPKVNGALNLHYATLHNKLDYFVCYSSISSFIGNASQSNYAAANSFLDMFCNYRQNIGLAGQSINWGPLNLGLLLNKDSFQRFLEAKGMMVMDVSEVHEALEKCLWLNNPQQVICKFNFKNLSSHVLSQNAFLRERLTALVKQELDNTNITEPRVQPLSKTAHENVRAMLCEISNVSIDDVNDGTSLCELGIDSMLAMTLQNRIFQERGVNVPLVNLLDPNTTLLSLVAIIKEDG